MAPSCLLYSVGWIKNWIVSHIIHYFQLNINSLSGYYGKSAEKLAQYLLKKDYYNFIGSDLHHFRHIEALSNPITTLQLKTLIENGKIMNPKLF